MDGIPVPGLKKMLTNIFQDGNALELRVSTSAHTKGLTPFLPELRAEVMH